jgi:DNA-binding XRE family transcriptional regulator
MKNYYKKPFPWRCSNCGEQAVFGAVVDYSTTEHHDGHAYTVKIDGLKTPKCIKCGRVAPDSEAMDVIFEVFMRQINLLMPEQIQEHRLKAKLTEQELATALGVQEVVVKELESGLQIQSRSLDNLMRLFFGLAQVREILTTHRISTLPASPEPATV